jgi:Mrp family chromosome partitioning ATPase
MRSTGGSRLLSSLFLQNGNLPTKTYNFGSSKVIDFSMLSARQSAEFEDELLSSFRKDDNRLVDPLLGKMVSKKGLDWIRSISIPSTLSFEQNVPSDHVCKSIVIYLQPPTLLHPQLHKLASNIAVFIQEEVASLILTPQKPQWPAWKEKPNPNDIPVEIRIQPQSTRQKSTPSLKTSQTTLPTLQNVKHFLAVYSCKGGVGKSTIAANLAYQLAASGGRIGLLDLDVYGPSLPLLVKPSDPTVRKSPLGEGIIQPIEHKGVNLMSLGYVSPNSGVPGSGPNGSAAVLRGPMAGRVVSQLLKGTNWGELDVLILDLPPGTGDVQLEVCQSLSLSGAVAVSTPSNLAWADVLKGVQMFGELGVATLGLVENMAYFVCEGGGRHYPFGKSHSLNEDDCGNASKWQFLPNPSHVFHLPISTIVNVSNDSGSPLCCDRPDGAEDELKAFSQLADAVAADLMLIQHGLPPLSVQAQTASGKGILTVVLDEAGELEFDVPLTQMSVDNQKKSFTVRLFSNEGGYQKSINGRDLRYRDPKTGDIEDSLISITARDHAHNGCGGSHSGKTMPSMVQHHSACNHDHGEKDRLFPATLTRKGNYGYEVAWADGAKIIYSLFAIAKAAGAYAKQDESNIMNH